MPTERSLFTSESVTEGHPDKIADRISDAVLDAVLDEHPEGRVACETLVTTGLVILAGEITTDAFVDFRRIVEECLTAIGYTDAGIGLCAADAAVIASIDPQSPDIAQGVDPGGAGDQGMMFGYACRETEELMPLPISLAHALTRRLAEVRKAGERRLRPDGKSQVTVEYEGDHPLRVDTVVVSTQHVPDIDQTELHELVREEVLKPILPLELVDDELKVYINPTGRFVVGGPKGDCGLTGRKIIVDTYGGMAPHGGGAFSGKDPTKVDRSATYMARYVAKNLVASGVADRATVQLAYAIGRAEPVSVRVDSHGTGRVSDRQLADVVRETFALTPGEIIDLLDLKRPIYQPTAAYGHFGREEESFTWERTDHAKAIAAAV